ncbi:hypothetical protein [Cardinium endosymbiont of Bemisia tabaci]|uniref:hypothetical protein n=1 Tax=Cardinium endosymbiont of Bemisia tabaci TaxID=672794 RepID=UPI0012EC3521|nr:hypothetical protein [Cardinium endosymbiont of Bemisia tabaci]
MGCKDFKNWESIYGNELKIKFQVAMDEWAPGVPEDLGSEKLSGPVFSIEPTFLGNKENFKLTDILKIPLDSSTNQVSFELIEATIGKQNPHHQKVTIYYETIVSMISPQAGGLQIQYRIKGIQFDKNTEKAIFKRFEIEHPVLLNSKNEGVQTHVNHVTLYY